MAPFSFSRLQVHSPPLSRSLLAPRHLSPFHSRAFRRAKAITRYTGYFAMSSVFGVLALGAGIFIHDVFTYSDQHVDRVPVSPLALNPERGGPKNLPIVRVQVDDEQDEENIRLAGKPKLVILGGGWGVSLGRKLQFTSKLSRFPGYGRTANSAYGRLSCHSRFSGHVHNFYSSSSMYVKNLFSQNMSLITLF